ncbi:MAG: M56 family metallopeptidase [Methylotenera sp.]|nr:M56 family metallopeptidase [Flavobacterium sp.]
MTLYIIKIILCSAVFILMYKLLLENERMHTFNRFYLLSSLLFSFCIPLITFTSSKPLQSFSQNDIFDTIPLQDNHIIQKLSPEQSTNYIFLILLSIYVTITAVLLFRFVINIFKILSKVRTHETIPYKNSRIVLIDEDLTPHSFLYYLFLNKTEYNYGNIENEVLIHEHAHIQQKHTYDILLIEVLQVVFWFNPFIVFFKKALKLNHEFLADEAVINSSLDISTYQYLLIEKSSKTQANNLTSQFNYSIIKKRLLMMTKTKSFKSALCRQIAIVPVFALSIFAFSNKTLAQDTSNVSASTTKKSITPSTQGGVSHELMNEYDQIVSKTKNEKGYPSFSKFSDADKSRLEEIYLLMSKDQQTKQIVIFSPAPPPLPRVIPTQSQIESWKNSKVYGLWINGNRVSNATLNNYDNTAFAQVNVSKLSKNAVNYGKHYYQVSLMTTDHYEAYYKQTIESKKKFYMGIRLKKNEGTAV